MKNDIIEELTAMAEIGECSYAVAKAVSVGMFDDDINDLECIDVSEAADLIISLARVRGIK